MAANTNNRQLKTFLGVAFGIAVGIGGTIGVGILRNPGEVAAMLQNGWLMMACWIMGGLYILLSVGTFAELSAMLPKAGGAYNYVKKAFGNFAGFFVGWFDYIMNSIAPAYFCIVIGEYLELLFPALAGHALSISIVTLLLFTLLHAGGLKNGSIMQQLSSLVKLIVFIILIIALFTYSSTPTSNFTSLPSGLMEGGMVLAIFKSLQLILGTYDGWMGACFFAEENRNPGKSVPRALFSGAIIVIIIYVLVNAALLYVLPIQDIANSKLAVSDAANVVFGASGKKLVTIIAVISLISILNVYMMIPSRILFGLSRDKFFFSFGARINKGGTPYFALLISTLLSLILILVGTFNVLFSLATFISLIVLGASYLSLLKLRKSRPELLRPYKAWGYPFSTILLIVVTVSLFIGFALADSDSFFLILAISIIAAIVYKLFVQSKKAV